MKKICEKCGESMTLTWDETGIVLDVYPELHPCTWICPNKHTVHDYLPLEEANEIDTGAP